VRILLVSQMYPGPSDPDLGVFVRGLEQALAARGHVVERAVLDRRRSGKRKYLTLSAATLQASRRFRPDVVYAHFLVPTGLIAALAARAPLVVTAHGRDVRNVGWLPGIRAATQLVVRRAATVIAVSDYLRRELETKVPEARGKTEVVDSGVDLERFTVAPAPAGDVRFLCIASLIGRKNVLRLADAFARVGRGTLTFVGDGPLRAELEGRNGVELVGRIAYDRVPEQIAAAHVVCQPSLIEPFGQAVLDAHRRPAGVRPARRGRARRSRRRGCAPRRAGRGRVVPVPQPGGARGRRGARRQGSGGEGGGDSRASCSRSASLSSTSGRIDSSSPASRAASSACS
jgi:glycosyltransferase involved in cell wall biosynthesis